MRLSYLRPQTISRLTDDWFWNTKRKPTKKWQAKFKGFLFEKLKAWGWLTQFRENRVLMKQVEFRVDNLVDLIHMQMHQLMDEGRRPTEIILGYEEWDRLTRDAEFHSYISFTFAPRETPYPPLFGMKVRVVPYINGVVVLPEDK